MKVAVVIPDRGDRPKFLRQCKKMLKRQTRKPDAVYLMNFGPTSSAFDLTKRVRLGFEKAKRNGFDCVLIIENDDYYSEDYIETMVSKWQELGRPNLLGIDSTTYYHLKKRAWRTMDHKNRSSLFTTLISCKAEFDFPSDNEVFLDLYLWGVLKGKTFSTDKKLAIGIKHGVGKCGGKGHSTFIYTENDPYMSQLEKWTDENSFIFYINLFA